MWQLISQGPGSCSPSDVMRPGKSLTFFDLFNHQANKKCLGGGYGEPGRSTDIDSSPATQRQDLQSMALHSGLTHCKIIASQSSALPYIPLVSSCS